MISLNDTHPAPKPVESYRVRKEAMDAAVYVIGPHARHGFEYETSKVDGRWIWRHTDEVRPDTPAELKANGGKKSLMLASTPMAHVGAAKPVKLPVPPRRVPTQPDACTYPQCKCIVSTSTSKPDPDCPKGLPRQAPRKPAGAPDGGAGGEQPPSDEKPTLPDYTLTDIRGHIEKGERKECSSGSSMMPTCNGLDVAPQHELDSMRKTEGNHDPLALPDFLKRKPAPAKSGTYDEMKSAGALRSEPVAKPVGKSPVSRKAAKAKTAPKAAKRASKAPAKRAGASEGQTKTALIGQLLSREGGCTTADILKATGWKAVNVPREGGKCGLKLKQKKDGSVTRYWAA